MTVIFFMISEGVVKHVSLFTHTSLLQSNPTKFNRMEVTWWLFLVLRLNKNFNFGDINFKFGTQLG